MHELVEYTTQAILVADRKLGHRDFDHHHGEARRDTSVVDVLLDQPESRVEAVEVVRHVRDAVPECESATADECDALRRSEPAVEVDEESP